VYILNYTRTLYARVYSTPNGHLRYLFLNNKFEVSQVPNDQKQALVNALIMYAPSPVICMQTPQREFAAAKVIHFCSETKFFDKKSVKYFHF